MFRSNITSRYVQPILNEMHVCARLVYFMKTTFQAKCYDNEFNIFHMVSCHFCCWFSLIRKMNYAIEKISNRLWLDVQCAYVWIVLNKVGIYSFDNWLNEISLISQTLSMSRMLFDWKIKPNAKIEVNIYRNYWQ